MRDKQLTGKNYNKKRKKRKHNKLMYVCFAVIGRKLRYYSLYQLRDSQKTCILYTIRCFPPFMYTRGMQLVFLSKTSKKVRIATFGVGVVYFLCLYLPSLVYSRSRCIL